MIRIKVCGMCDPLNVKEIAEAKPDFMGFIFYSGSPRYVGAEPDRSLFINVPPGIPKTGVFVNEDPDRILDLTLRTGLDIIQLHGTETPGYCNRLRSSGLIIIKAFNIAKGFDFGKIKPYMEGCDYFIFDTKTEKAGGSGIKFNWEILENYNLDKPFFLSGGIGPEDIEIIKAIERRGFFAVDVNSRFETSPGIKNVALVKSFIEEIKNNNYEL
jgi:phosphoribosylanthranilate isomerase